MRELSAISSQQPVHGFIGVDYISLYEGIWFQGSVPCFYQPTTDDGQRTWSVFAPLGFNVLCSQKLRIDPQILLRNRIFYRFRLAKSRRSFDRRIQTLYVPRTKPLLSQTAETLLDWREFKKSEVRSGVKECECGLDVKSYLYSTYAGWNCGQRRIASKLDGVAIHHGWPEGNKGIARTCSPPAN